MSPSHGPDPELDALIEEITIDCYDEDEALTGFENAFDEDAGYPIPATLIGHDVEILSIHASSGRRELIATCQHTTHKHDVALPGLTIHPRHPAARLHAAYRHWLGA